jgi:hypothetical protein
MIPPDTSARDLLRHCLATIAYRAAKVVHGAPDSFADFHSSETTRTPIQILAHLGDLFDWALSMVQGQPAWHDSQPLLWQDEIHRFFAALQKFDQYLAGPDSLHASPEKLFQGPVADALNHIGQLAILRRIAGAPIKGENYFKADISAGSLSPDQPKPKHEFD